MFCQRCRTELPDAALYCWKCGTQIELPSDVPGAGFPAGTGASVKPALPQKSKRALGDLTVMLKSARGPYVWLTLDLLGVAFLLTFIVFNVAWQSVVGPPDKVPAKIGQSFGEIFIPLLLLLYGAKRAWKSLLEQEPETNRLFRKKHWKFQAAAIATMLVISISAVSNGVAAARREEKNKKLEGC